MSILKEQLNITTIDDFLKKFEEPQYREVLNENIHPHKIRLIKTKINKRKLKKEINEYKISGVHDIDKIKDLLKRAYKFHRPINSNEFEDDIKWLNSKLLELKAAAAAAAAPGAGELGGGGKRRKSRRHGKKKAKKTHHKKKRKSRRKKRNTRRKRHY